MARRLGDGPASNRPFVMVDRGLFDLFHRRSAEIEREWSGAWQTGDPAVVSAATDAVRYARAELREEVRRLAEAMPGPCLLPV